MTPCERANARVANPRAAERDQAKAKHQQRSKADVLEGEITHQLFSLSPAAHVTQDLALDLALGAGADLVNGLDQQVHQVVGQATGAQIDEGRQPGDACRIGMAAQIARHLDRNTLSTAFQIARRGSFEQISG